MLNGGAGLILHVDIIHSHEASKMYAGISVGGFSDATHLNCSVKIIEHGSDSFKNMTTLWCNVTRY